MKIIVQDNASFILRFDSGEDIISGLQNFMKEQSISVCTFSGVGACSSVELGFFNTHIKDYRKKPYIDEMEILSLNGNGSLKEGESFIHCHGMFGRNDFTVLGGHIFKLVVSVTAEIFLTKLNGMAKRELNSEFNLNLLN